MFANSVLSIGIIVVGSGIEKNKVTVCVKTLFALGELFTSEYTILDWKLLFMLETTPEEKTSLSAF